MKQDTVRLGPEHEEGIKKLQVGCGPKNILTDWWNVDIRSFPGIDLAMDVTQPWNLNGLEYVYGEHFLEHINLEGAMAFLNEAWKSLKVGGVIRLSTPSLEWVLSTHFDLSETSKNKKISSTFAMNRAFHGWGHQFIYSQEFLTDLLENIGYEDVKYCDYGKSEHPELNELERHGNYRIDNDYPSVWIVEGTKAEFRSESDVDSYGNYLQDSYTRFVDAGH